MTRTLSGLRLRQRRHAAGLTVDQAADKVARSTHSIRSYECGRVAPKPDVLGELAVLYGCEVSDFYIDQSAEDPILEAARQVAQALPLLSPEKQERVRALLGAA